MATVDYWAEAPMNRQQISLFAPTLDAMISDDDPVRLVDEVLRGIDWSLWEAEYDGCRGQPRRQEQPRQAGNHSSREHTGLSLHRGNAAHRPRFS